MSDEIKVPWKCKKCGKETMYGDYNYCPSCLGVVSIEELEEIQVIGCKPYNHKWLIGESGIADGKPCMCGERVWNWYTVGLYGVSKPNGKRKAEDETDERGITKLADNSDSDNMGGANSDDVATYGSAGSAAAGSDDADGSGGRPIHDGHDDSDSDPNPWPDEHGTTLPWPW